MRRFPSAFWRSRVGTCCPRGFRQSWSMERVGINANPKRFRQPDTANCNRVGSECPPYGKQYCSINKISKKRKTWCGFAYGRGSDGIAGRKVALAVTAGIKKSDYCPQGRYHFSLREVLTPFELAFKYYFRADYRGFFAFYGAEETPGVDYVSSQDDLERGAREYAEFLRNLE